MPDIEKLDDTNYAEWAIKMEALLVEREVWGVVSGSESRPRTAPGTKIMKADIKKQQLARAKIILHVENSQHPHTRDPDPQVIWDELARIHRSRGFGSILSMRRRFYGMSKNPDHSMRQWVASV